MSAQAQNTKKIAKSNTICNKELNMELVNKNKKADKKIKKLEKKVMKMKKKYKKIKAKYEEIIDIDTEEYIDNLKYEILALKQDKETLEEDLGKMEKEKEKWRWDCKTQDMVIEQQQKKLKARAEKKIILKTVSCQTISHEAVTSCQTEVETSKPSQTSPCQTEKEQASVSCQTKVKIPGSYQNSACQIEKQQSTTSCQTEVILQIPETSKTGTYQNLIKTTSSQTTIQATSCQTEASPKEEVSEIKNAICCTDTVKPKHEEAEEQISPLPFVKIQCNEIQKFVHFGSVALLIYKRKPNVNQGNRYLKIALKLRAAFIVMFMIVIGLIKFVINVCRREIFRLRHAHLKFPILPPGTPSISKDLEIWKNDRKSDENQEIESYSTNKKLAIGLRNRYDNFFLHKIIFSFVGFLIFGIFIGVFFVVLFASMYGLIKNKIFIKTRNKKRISDKMMLIKKRRNAITAVNKEFGCKRVELLNFNNFSL